MKFKVYPLSFFLAASLAVCAFSEDEAPVSSDEGMPKLEEPAAPAEEKPDLSAQIDDSLLDKFRIYVSRPGDTLYSLSAKFLGSDSSWEEIHQYNKYIVDPKKIYPGTELIIPIPEPPRPKVRLAVTNLQQEIMIDARDRAKADEEQYMIVPENYKFDGMVFGQKEDRVMISINDVVYIDQGSKKGVKVGDRFAVYRRGREIIHPDTDDLIGIVIEKIGLLEVTGGIKESSAAAIIITAAEPISMTDPLKKLKQ